MPSLPIRTSRFGSRRGTSGGPQADLVDVDDADALRDCAVYRRGIRQTGSGDWHDALEQIHHDPSGFVWIGLYEPSEVQMSAVADAFDLHELAVEDAVHAHQRPKLEEHDNSLFAVVKTVKYESDGDSRTTEVVQTGEIMVFLGSNFVITVRHGAHGELHDLRHQLESDPSRLSRGPSVVLHAILDSVVDNYVRVALQLQAEIDDIETNVFDGHMAQSETNRIYGLKRQVLALKRATAPLSHPLRQLASHQMPFVHDDLAEYFRDVDDHLISVSDQVAAFDDLLNTLVAANLAQVGVRQNEDMRKMAAWVAIISVPTMVFGLYGMNFHHMPELSWQYGYPLVISIVASGCMLLYRNFKRNGWL
jgi:magnesium transporter